MFMTVVYIAVGFVAGAASGFVGIGGGIIIIPLLVYLSGFTQHQAQGTTLSLIVPPIGLLAAWTYYKHGYVNLVMAFLSASDSLSGVFLARVQR
jgi:uncharacterized membrane protein YfcA